MIEEQVLKFGYLPLHIAGEVSDSQSGERHSVICPATGELIGEVAKTGPQDAEIALKAAQEAFKSWSALSVEERVGWLRKFHDVIGENRDTLAEALMYETGKPWDQAALEVTLLMGSIAYCCDNVAEMGNETIPEFGKEIYDEILAVARGKRTKSEILGHYED